MTKSDFYDWKRHPVTQQVYSQLHARIELLKDEIVSQAREGIPTVLAHKAGAIEAYSDMLNIDIEETLSD